MSTSITSKIRWLFIIGLSLILLSTLSACGGGFIDPTFQEEAEDEKKETEEDPNTTDEGGGISKTLDIQTLGQPALVS
ncbi:hypothetical protein MJD09_00735 [bacterium]|nr:hypothetical protein [bacterium]